MSTPHPLTTPPHPHLLHFYHDPALRREFLRDLFDGVAPDYDRILQYAFLGTGNAYRRRAIRLAGLLPGMRLLDVACGTGAVAAAALRVLEPGQVVCVDPSAGMRGMAREKLGDEVVILEGDAESLPVESGIFDRLVMGYGLRHVASLEDAFGEYFRVLKPGGVVLLLEISRPRSRLAGFFVRAYMRYVVPFVGWLVTHNRQGHTLMRYFWESIDQCVCPQAILDALRNRGFTAVARRTELGVFSAYTATKPNPQV